MHEMSIAMNIIDISIRTALDEQASKINKIVVEIGALAGIVTESLLFCYDAAARGTIAEGSELEIVSINGQAACTDCGHQFEAVQHVAACPNCGEITAAVSGGRELKILSINVD